MSTDRDVTRIVRSWLEDGVTKLPDRVLDNVLDELPATPQRRPWWPAWRLREMNTPLRIAVAAVAVVAVAVIGLSVMPRNGGGVGGQGPVASPGPTATPAPTPSPSSAPTLPSGAIPPGTYRSLFVTYALPAGWSRPDSSAPTIFKTGVGSPNDMVVDLWNIVTVYNDPCHWQTTGAIVGPTVDNLVTALVAQDRGSTAKPVDVTIDGYTGKQIDLVVPLNIKVTKSTSTTGPSELVTGCDGSQYKTWTGSDGGDRYNQGPGQHDLLDVLDVNGQTLVIDRVFWPANSVADRAELQAIVDSIKVTP